MFWGKRGGEGLGGEKNNEKTPIPSEQLRLPFNAF